MRRGRVGERRVARGRVGEKARRIVTRWAAGGDSSCAGPALSHPTGAAPPPALCPHQQAPSHTALINACAPLRCRTLQRPHPRGGPRLQHLCPAHARHVPGGAGAAAGAQGGGGGGAGAEVESRRWGGWAAGREGSENRLLAFQPFLSTRSLAPFDHPAAPAAVPGCGVGLRSADGCWRLPCGPRRRGR